MVCVSSDDFEDFVQWVRWDGESVTQEPLESDVGENTPDAEEDNAQQPQDEDRTRFCTVCAVRRVNRGLAGSFWIRFRDEEWKGRLNG